MFNRLFGAAAVVLCGVGLIAAVEFYAFFSAWADDCINHATGEWVDCDATGARVRAIGIALFFPALLLAAQLVRRKAERGQQPPFDPSNW